MHNRARRRGLYALLCVLSVLVAGGVTYELVRPAITITIPPGCGIEAHVHSDSCYESHLTCGLEEGEQHAHGPECYATVLVCDRAQHTHEESCYPR